MQLNVGLASRLAAFIEGGHVQITGEHSAVLTLCCKSQWSGRVLVQCPQNVVSITMTIAKCPYLHKVDTDTASVRNFAQLVCFIVKCLSQHYKNMKAVNLPMSPPVWKATEKDLMIIGTTCAQLPLHPAPVCLQRRPGAWTVKFFRGDILYVTLRLDAVDIERLGNKRTWNAPAHTSLHPNRQMFMCGSRCEAELLLWLINSFKEIQQY